MKKRKKILISALAALAGGGILYALYSKDEEQDDSGKVIGVQPPSGGSDPTQETEEEVLGGGGGGGVGGGGGGGVGGGGGGANLILCRGLDEEGNETTELVNPSESCPDYAPFSDDLEYDDFVYDSFNCFDVDEDGEVIAQEKEFTEVCGVDYPEYPFDTQNDALLYASDPETYEGCTDETAFNFNEEALIDDGSCEAVVEGCKVEGAENFDAEANTENNDLCEFPPEAVLGCTNDTAKNFDESADTDDGSCLYDVTCYFITDAPYSVSSEVIELGEGMTCEGDVAPTYLDLVYEGGVVSDFMQSGYYNTSENATAYLNGAQEQADEIGGSSVEYSTCFFISTDGEVQSSTTFTIEEGEDCTTIEYGIPLFNTFEDAEESLGDLDELEVQSCYNWDSQGVYILDDLPYIDGDTGDIIPCESLGYFSLGIGGEDDAEEAYQEYLSTLVAPEPDTEQEGEPIDNSAIANGDINDCSLGGAVSADTILLFNQSSMTSQEVNDLLGFECFDTETGANMYTPVVPAGFIPDAFAGQNMVIECFGGVVNDLSMSLFQQVTSMSYPLSPNDFNSTIGFPCLNDAGQVVNPQEPDTGGGDTSVIDDSGETPDPIVGEPPVAVGDDSDTMPPDDPTDTPNDFMGFSNASNTKGCTDPIALNFSEGAEIDDGTCDY